MSLKCFLVFYITLSISFLPSYAGTARRSWDDLSSSISSPEPITHARAGSHSACDGEKPFADIDKKSGELAVLTDRRYRLSTSHVIFIDQLEERIPPEAAKEKFIDGLKICIVFPHEKKVCEISITLFPGIIEEGKIKMVTATEKHPTLQQALAAINDSLLDPSQSQRNVIIAETSKGFQKVTSVDVGEVASGLCVLMRSDPLL